jgi:hypothetical protein
VYLYLVSSIDKCDPIGLFLFVKRFLFVVVVVVVVVVVCAVLCCVCLQAIRKDT